MYSKTTNQGVTQDIINANYALRLNYMYDRRYAVEADMALMGSNRFKREINTSSRLRVALPGF